MSWKQKQQPKVLQIYHTDMLAHQWIGQWNKNMRVWLPDGSRPRLKHLITDDDKISKWIGFVENPYDMAKTGNNKSSRYTISWIGWIQELNVWYQLDRRFVRHIKTRHDDLWHSRNQISWLIEHPIVIGFTTYNHYENGVLLQDMPDYRLLSMWGDRLVCIVYSHVGHRLVTAYPITRGWNEDIQVVWRDEKQIREADERVQQEIEHELLADLLVRPLQDHDPKENTPVWVMEEPVIMS